MAGRCMNEDEILDEHPDPEKADLAAVYQFAAELVGELCVSVR